MVLGRTAWTPGLLDDGLRKYMQAWHVAWVIIAVLGSYHRPICLTTFLSHSALIFHPRAASQYLLKGIPFLHARLNLILCHSLSENDDQTAEWYSLVYLFIYFFVCEWILVNCLYGNELFIPMQGHVKKTKSEQMTVTVCVEYLINYSKIKLLPYLFLDICLPPLPLKYMPNTHNTSGLHWGTRASSPWLSPHTLPQALNWPLPGPPVAIPTCN